jgi:hypothetical protein
MSPVADHSKSRLATRLCFAAAGFGVACWAPLVPFDRCGRKDRSFGFAGKSIENAKEGYAA